MTDAGETGRPYRAGVVALLGRANAGKSTLMNRLLGEKLAIVTSRPQTTRSRILGILTLPNAQLVLQDTPGLHDGTKPLNEALNEQAFDAARKCDLGLLLVDRSRGYGEDHAALVEQMTARGTAPLVIETKCDLPAREGVARVPESLSPISISARTGEGLDALLEAIVARLDESPPLFPEDELSDRPLRFLAAELVRESAFLALHKEIPYELAVEIRDFDESRPERVHIRADVIVERASQKRIVIGTGGAQIKEIGIRARREIEHLLDTKVHLELWVKVEPKWSRKPARLRALGYS